MPAMFIAVSSNFVITECAGSNTPAQKLAGSYRKYLELKIFQPETPNISIKFEVSDDSIQEGSFDISENGDSVSVNCDFIAKINVKSNYADKFLDTSSKWIFGSACGVDGTIDGLTSEDYEVTSFRGTEIENYYLIPVKTAKNLKGVK